MHAVDHEERRLRRACVQEGRAVVTTMAVNAAGIPQGMQFVNSSVIATPAAAAVLAPPSFSIGGFPPSTLSSVQVPVASAIGAPAMPLANGQTAVAGVSGGGAVVGGGGVYPGAVVATTATIGGVMPTATAPPSAVAGASGPGVGAAGGGGTAAAQAQQGAACTMPDCPMHAGGGPGTVGGGPVNSEALQQVLASLTQLITQLTTLLQQQTQPVSQEIQTAA